MADVHNKLRLQIVTELDAAGIKATKEQVDQLELGVRRAGTSASTSGQKFGDLEKSIGKLPGRIGEVAGKLGGLAGQATMLFGAFSFGVEIGNKIMDLMREWGVLANPLEEMRKANAKYNYELQQMKENLADVIAEEAKRIELSSAAADNAIKKIDDQTAAYFRQQVALDGLKKAENNAQMIQLQREKFDEMSNYSANGYAEAAEQVGKYYDVLISELEAKQRIEEFDRQSVQLTKELSAAEESYLVAAKNVQDAKQKQADAELALDRFRRENARYYNAQNNDVLYNDDKAVAQDDALEQIVANSKKNLARAIEIAAKRSQRLENVDAEVLQRQMERANLAAQGALGVDRAAQAYDDYVANTGNPIEAAIDQNWAAEMLRSAQEADRVQKDMLQEIKQFSSRLEQLLEVK